MPFQPGQSGNPAGSHGQKIFREALRLTLMETDGDRTKLRRVAEKLVASAIEGDVLAIREIANRMDGKADETVNVTFSLADALRALASGVGLAPALADRSAELRDGGVAGHA